MRAKSPTGCQVVKKDEKCALLKAFVMRNLETRLSAERNPIFVVARSFESPVARVIASLADEIAARGLTVRAVITAIDTGDFGGNITVGPGAPFTAENTRVVRDARLYDAHEQLVLDSSTSWIGDCMRREPAKTDSYERFVEPCPMTAQWTRQSFGHLWNAGQPASFAAGPMLGVLAIPEAIGSMTLHGQTVKEAILTSATRH
jgi:hypothetical protein